MKNIFLFMLFLFIAPISFSQLPYSWTAGVDPGWISSNSGNGSALDWQNGCNAVAVNCGGYANNQNTSYTSPVIDASCNNASTISIQFDFSGNIEFSWDFLFMEYSTDGGATWTNFYGPNVGLTGNAGGGTTWTLPPVAATNSFMFRFTFDSDFSFTSSGYQITNFQINCNVQLPVVLIEQSVHNKGNENVIIWKTASEINSDYYQIERSTDGITWEIIGYETAAGNSNQQLNYQYMDRDYTEVVNYYRIKQVDFNGDFEYFDIMSVDNTPEDREVIMVTNMLGQQVDQYYTGLRIIYYSNGESEKVMGN